MALFERVSPNDLIEILRSLTLLEDTIQGGIAQVKLSTIITNGNIPDADKQEYYDFINELRPLLEELQSELDDPLIAAELGEYHQLFEEKLASISAKLTELEALLDADPVDSGDADAEGTTIDDLAAALELEGSTDVDVEALANLSDIGLDVNPLNFGGQALEQLINGAKSGAELSLGIEATGVEASTVEPDVVL